MPKKRKMDLQFFAENEEEVEETEEKQEDTLTQEEVDRIVAQQKSKAKEEARKELESEYLEKAKELAQQKIEDEKAKQELNSDELEKYYKNQLQKMQDDFDSKVAEYQAKENERELKDLSIRLLGEKNLPINDKVLFFVVKENEANTRQAIDDLADILLDAKNQSAVHEPTLGGGTIKGNKGLKQTFDDARII